MYFYGLNRNKNEIKQFSTHKNIQFNKKIDKKYPDWIPIVLSEKKRIDTNKIILKKNIALSLISLQW